MDGNEYETVIRRVKRVAFYVISIITALAVFFLGFSFIFRLLGANPASPFVALTYSLSAPFRLPFVRIFSDASRVPIYEDAAVDLTALVAIFSYLALYMLLILLLNLAEKIALQATQKRETPVDTHSSI